MNEAPDSSLAPFGLARPAQGQGWAAKAGRRLPVVIVVLLGSATLASIPVSAAPVQADLDQCRNGSLASPTSPCTWTNGNLGTTNSHFVEGQSVPYRMVVTNLVPGTTVHSITIGFDIKNGGKHAIDYLTSFQRIAETVNPCFGISPCALTDTEPIPTPAGTPQPQASFNALPASERLMSIYQGTILSIAYTTQGNLAAANSEAQMTITFTAASPTVVLAWGGHIASTNDWGAGEGAAGISGSSYHMRLKNIDGGGGGQDRSMQTGAVAPTPPAALRVIKTVVNDNGGTATSSAFAVHVRYAGNNTDVAGSPQPGNAAGTAYSGLLAGSYKVGEDRLPGYQLTITGDCAANGGVVLASGQTKTCTLTNNDLGAHLTVNKVVVNDDGGNATAAAWALFVNATQVGNGVPTAFNAGTYVVSEQGLPGYAATFSGDCNAQGQVTLALNTTRTCTITNNDTRPLLTVTKVVVNDHGGTAQVADFPLLVDATGVTSGSQHGFDVGTHHVSETGMTGYASRFSGDCDDAGNVSLAPGNVKSCTITNDDIQPLLTVVKMVVNDDGGTSIVADADLFVDGGNVTSGEQNGFDAGAHTVTENGPPGYQPTFSGDCDANGTVRLAVGDAKTCVITNDDIRPLLTVTKVVTNDNGGNATVGSFPLFVDDTQVTSGQATGFPAGGHVVSEQGSDAYSSSITGDCDAVGNVSLAVGDVKSCTITNDDIQPRLTVVKRVVNDDGGQATVGDFALFVGDQSVLSGDEHGLDVGTYNVSELGPGGYDATFEGDCDENGTVVLDLAEVNTCVITNDDIRPLLTVTKIVVNDDGGTAAVGDWDLFADATQVKSGAQNGFDAGSYNVTEDGPVGYRLTYSGDCDTNGTVTMAIGEVKSCSLTNDDVAPLLTVVKVVINDDGGDATVNAWDLFVGATQVANGTTNSFLAGTHAVSETGLGGYAGSFGGDCDADGNVTLAVGDDKTCTLTNDDIGPLLTVTKVVVNDDGGTAVVADVPLFVDATSVTSGAQNGFDAGPHLVSETGMTGYTASFGGDCDSNGAVSLSPGDVKACTITNDDRRPLLTVVKMVVNDDGGTSVVADANLFVDGGNVTSGAQNGFDAGSHNVTENGPPGYQPTFSGDCDEDGTVVLLPGDVKTCVITNDDIRPLLSVTKIVVNDDGGTAVVAGFPLFVDGGNVTSGDVNGFEAGSHVVDETGSPDYGASIGGDCDAGGNVTLAVGDVTSCTITNDDVQARLVVVKRVINDDGGNATVADFGLFVDAGSVISGDSHGYGPGMHTVTETGPGGYSGSFGGDCDENGTVELDIGDDKTCVVLNDDVQARLTVTKVVVNDDGGSAAVADFGLFVDATQVTSGLANGFDAGSYQVSELGPGHYVLTYSGDCDETGAVTLFIGDDLQCTLTNDDLPAPCPSGLQLVSNQDGSITVTWTPAAGSDATRLYRSVGGGSLELIGSFNETTTRFTDSDTDVGQSYAYVMTALYGDRESTGCDVAESAAIPEFPTLAALFLALLGGPLAYALLRRRKV
ncbi:MAG TPA: hypothetical protein VM327_01570 [Candidatus Thermoplasmatota archaeon]|nr:hypothetical protein [Candidatus Thermoplasmatota archaeon]